MVGLPKRLVVAGLMILLAAAPVARASDDETGGTEDQATDEYGEYEPNSGFKVASTDQGDLNLRIFTYVRYLNQKGLDPTYTDSFGQTSTLDRRQDIQFQKVTINFYGWLMDPKLRYLLYVWTSNTSQGQGAQVVVGGNLNYAFNPHLTLGGGIDAPARRARHRGQFPVLADGRQPPDCGRVLPAVLHHGSLGARRGRRPPQLPPHAGQQPEPARGRRRPARRRSEHGDGRADLAADDRRVRNRAAASAISTRIEKVATRVAAHFTRSDENRQGQPNTDCFENVQIRLSDGNPIFTPEPVRAPASRSAMPRTTCSAPMAASSIAASRSTASSTGGG